MAKGFKHGAGGGFLSESKVLNFVVVGGTTEPEKPTDNMIWVKTDAEITSWVFSATEPKEPLEGMVWISTGTSSTAAFNALQKNVIQVYPISAKQHSSGGWVDKEANIRKNGNWTEWMAYLYNAGDTCDLLTGGWANFGTTNQFYTNALEVTGVKAMALNTDTNSSQNWSYASTLQKIDLTPYKTLRARVSGGKNAEGYPRIGYGNSQSAYTAYAEANSEHEQDIALDISNVTGEWFVLFASNMGSTTEYNYCYEVILL